MNEDVHQKCAGSPLTELADIEPVGIRLHSRFAGGGARLAAGLPATGPVLPLNGPSVTGKNAAEELTGINQAIGLAVTNQTIADMELLPCRRLPHLHQAGHAV